MYQVYKILDDDTLDSLALRMNINSDEICRLNGFSTSDFVPGELIVLPKKNDSLFYSYVVKAGDTLYSISNEYNVDLNTLYAINGLDDGDIIYPNEEIIIPRDNNYVYITKSGDSISDVVDNIGFSYKDFIDNNQNLLLEPDQMVIYKRD